MAPLFNHINRVPTLTALCFSLIVLPHLVTAQFLKNIPYKGVDVSFGTRAFSLTSDIPELSGLTVLQEGGQLGVLLGNDVFRTKIGIAGFFYSANKVPRTVDLFQNDIALNFYPLMMAKNMYSRLHPYLSGGMIYDKVKYFGHYLNPDKATVNYSVSKEPYIGNTKQLRGVVGAGIEFTLLSNGRDFIHIYSELKYSATLTKQASHMAFNNTEASGQWLINLGVRFGSNNQ